MRPDESVLAREHDVLTELAQMYRSEEIGKLVIGSEYLGSSKAPGGFDTSTEQKGGKKV